MPMTKEQWKDAEKELQSFFSPVKLNCDGYEVTLILERYSQFKNVISVYVNGQIKGEWYGKECEERRRFFKKETKSVATRRSPAFKKLSKKMQKELTAKYSYDLFSPYWTSFGSLKKHIIKNNKEIELVKNG